MLQHLTDLADRAKARMLAQYRTVTSFVEDVGVLVGEVQEIEDAFWAMYLQLDLDVAEGVWLARLGGVVGEKREGFPDEYTAGTPPQLGYRDLVKARVLANKSRGTTDEILAVVEAALEGGPTPDLSLVDYYPAGQVLTVADFALGGQAGELNLNRIVRLVKRARAVAIDTQMLYQDDEDDAEIFVCGDSGGGPVVGKGFDDSAAPDDPAAGRLAGVAQA